MNTSKVKENLTIVFFTLSTILFLDMCGFMLWIASGQIPADEFYWGSITAHIAMLII